jgi:hypothetical protein
MLSAPVLLSQTNLPLVGDISAQAGNGKGKGASNGSGGGKKSSSASTSGKKAAGTNSGQNKKRASSTNEASLQEGPVPKEKNINAQLGRLNSLKRNINGLMNSADPHMAGLRAYVIAGAALVTATEALASAEGVLVAATTAYESYVNSFALAGYDGTAYTDLSLDGLNGRLTELNALDLTDPVNAAAANEAALLSDAIGQIEASQQFADLTQAQTDLEMADQELDTAEAAAGSDVLLAALGEASNKGEITPQVLDWASAKLGIGDADGLIDEYLERQ